MLSILTLGTIHYSQAATCFGSNYAYAIVDGYRGSGGFVYGLGCNELDQNEFKLLDSDGNVLNNADALDSSGNHYALTPAMIQHNDKAM